MKSPNETLFAEIARCSPPLTWAKLFWHCKAVTYIPSTEILKNEIAIYIELCTNKNKKGEGYLYLYYLLKTVKWTCLLVEQQCDVQFDFYLTYTSTHMTLTMQGVLLCNVYFI